MLIENTECPNCKSTLNPHPIDLVLKRTGSYWECKQCGYELRTSAEFDLILITITFLLGWMIYGTLKPIFEKYSYPMNFFVWCTLISICALGMITFDIIYSYFVYKFAFKKRQEN